MEITLCMCKNPTKEYSKSACPLCWVCKKCGNFGGCDNRYWTERRRIITNERYKSIVQENK